MEPLTGDSSHSNYIGELYEAIEHRDIRKLKDVLAARGSYDLDLEDDEYRERTPLSAAVETGNAHIVKALLENGASPNSPYTEEWGQRPIHLAAQNPDIQIMKLLLDAGAPIDGTDDCSVTPLIVATRRGHLDLVRFLLDRGANIHHLGQYEPVPLGLRMDYEYSTEEYRERTAEPYRMCTPIMEACRFRHPELLRELIKRGANITKATPIGNSLLHLAAFCEKSEKYIRNKDERSKWTILPTCPRVVDILLENGADVLAKNKFQETPIGGIMLHLAIIARHNESTKYTRQCLLYYYLNLCLLVKAGCPLDLEYYLPTTTKPHEPEHKTLSVLKLLTDAYIGQKQGPDSDDSDDQHDLEDAYITAMKAVVFSGIELPHRMLTEVAEELAANARSEKLLDFVTWLRNKSGLHTLRQLCQITVRNTLRRPFRMHVMSKDFKVPLYIKQCVMLEIDVPTKDWLAKETPKGYPNMGKLPAYFA